MLKISTKNLYYLITALGATLAALAVHARELPGDWPAGLQLGSGYDSSRHQEFFASCVEGQRIDISRATGDIKYTSEAKHEEIARAFSGSLSVGVKAPFVKVDASTEYALENSSTDERMNWFFEFNAIRQSESFSVSSLKINSHGHDALQAGYAAVPDWCGDEFVSTIDYGASLIGTMSVEFASKEDKEEFKLAAALDVNFLVGKAQASAKLQQMQQKMGSRTNVKVTAHQTGGNPGQLNGILGSGQIVRCTLSDMDNCLSAFENILRYANGDFKQQLTQASGYNVIRYHTTPYERSAARKLVPPQGFPLLDKMVLNKREQIQANFEKESMVHTRATYITVKLEPFTPPQQLLAVKEIVSKSWSNMVMLTGAMKMCLEHPDQSCLNQATLLETYNSSELDIKIDEQLDSNSNLGKLHTSIKKNDVNAAHLALKFGGKELITQCDPQGFNAGHQAVKQGRTEHLSLFIQNDPFKNDPNKSVVHAFCDNPSNYTPLCLAAQGGTFAHVECINLLCFAGATVNCTTKSNVTPLQVAVRHGKIETVRDLVRRKADHQIIDMQERNLLHLAAEGGDVLIIKYLIDELKFDISAKDREELAPLHWAARAGNHEAVNLLIGYGADHQAKDRAGRTALEWGLKHDDVVDALLLHHRLVIPSQEIFKGKAWRENAQIFFNNDGSLFAQFTQDKNSRNIAIRNTQTGALMQTLTGAEPLFSLEFSVDGSMLAGAGGGVLLWDLKTATRRFDLQGQTGPVHHVAFDPNGLELVGACEDNTLKVWDAKTGALLRTYQHWQAYGIRFSPDRSGPSFFLSMSTNDLRVYTFYGYYTAHLHYVNCASFSHDGSMFATALNDGSFHFFDGRLNEFIRKFTGHPGHLLWGLAFSRDSSIIVSSGHDKTIKLWNSQTGELLYTIVSDSKYKYLDKLSFSANDETLTIASDRSIKFLSLRWNSILHKAIEADNVNAVNLIVQKFPLLLHIRTPQGLSPLELAEELLAQKGKLAGPAFQQIVDYLNQQASRFPKKKAPLHQFF